MRRRRLVAISLLTLLLPLSAATAAPADDPAAAADVRHLAAEMERIHPNLYHSISRPAFRRAVDDLVARLPGLERDEVLVEAMRLLALTGERDGHMGLFPLFAGHARPFHFLPVRLYAFADGIYVIAAPGRPELVRTRLVAIGETAVDDLVTRVTPLITRDNDWDRLGRLPGWLITAEVLHGLGVTADAGSARLTLERPDGERLDVVLPAVTRDAYARLLGELWGPSAPPGTRPPLWLRNRSRTQWATTLDRGRVVYAAYSSTQDATALGLDLVRRAQAKRVRRVVLDVRLNGGGDNTSYGSLLAALRRPAIGRRGKLVLLTGRFTFSAAGNFAAEVEASTRARIVGEPPGGSPHNYGDSVPVELKALGWTVFVPPEYVQVLGREDERAVLRPDVLVETRAADYFAARDPVLEKAMSLR